MNSFKIHPQLSNDCIVLGELPACTLLLMNNASLPWFILVPRNDRSAVELTDLAFDVQTLVLKEINTVASLVKAESCVEKLNIAALGNIVPQLHIHIVGRSTTDYCWPKLVWVAEPQPAYDATAIEAWHKKVSTLQGFTAVTVL
jgi:diadenosine tetraphosphate (Ap4A) HIT family hydrolase